MQLDEVSRKYPVLTPVIKILKEKEGITSLFPPQADAVRAGYLDGKNMLLAIPTSAGKTLVSELGALKTVLEKRKKVLYLVPLKALAMEKYNDFKEKYESIGVKTAVSIGNFDGRDRWLADYDIIVTSVEKADSLLRHKAEWFSDIGLVIADEVHLLDDPSRGPTLEIVLTRIRELANSQIIALSATINNRKELAEWLDAILVESDFRPNVLHEGYVTGGKVVFSENTRPPFILPKAKDNLVAVVTKVVADNLQGLIFVSSKRSAEKVSEDISGVVGASLSVSDKVKLAEVSDAILSVVSSPTVQCKRLAKVVRLGSAFHHSGLVHGQKVLVEDAFRAGLIRFISATTTLAYGMNLPCDYVIMRDVKRFYGVRGYDNIPVLEYKQCVGRSGRAKYAKEGCSVILSKSSGEAEEHERIFIKGIPENIYSKLSLEPVLRIHLLSLIATGHIATVNDLEKFVAKTFYAHQFKDLHELFSKIENMITMLGDYGMVEKKKGGLSATPFGLRVAELYIDPLTADMFSRAIRQPLNISEDMEAVSVNDNSVSDDGSSGFISGADILESKSKVFNNFSILSLISSALEMQPTVRAKKADVEMIEEVIRACSKNILIEVPSKWDWERNKFMNSIKNTLFFDSWIRENTEDFIVKHYSVTPGELKIKLDNADWLLYTLEEFSMLFELKDVHRAVKKLRVQMKYGVLSELLKLVAIKGVGRVRARALFDKGFKSSSDLKKADLLVLEKIVGKKMSMKIKGLDTSGVSDDKKNKKVYLKFAPSKGLQKSLSEF